MSAIERLDAATALYFSHAYLHELILLPFRRRVDATLYLVFADGALLEVSGKQPSIELLGTPIYLEDVP